MKAKITDAGLKCKCGREAKPAKLSFQGEAIDGWQCASCGEKYYDPAQAQRILSLNKLRSKSVSVKLGRMKSNLFLRIPATIAELLALKQGETVNLRVKGLKDFEVNC